MNDQRLIHAVTFLAILASHAIAVPLAPSFPPSELRYVLDHSQSCALLSSAKFAKLASEVLKEDLESKPKSVQLEKIQQGSQDTSSIEWTEDITTGESGLMLYTSGTTARPKGVLLHQSVLAAQALSLLEAWKYSPKDRLLHVLPLHHIHGTVNALVTPLMAGSTIEFLFPFTTDGVWNRLAAPFLPDAKLSQPRITFLTAVPTVWSRLIQSHPQLLEETQKATKTAINRQNLRLNISGSAALPTPTKQAWTDLSSGNVLLERYGMTEVGMALSCGLDDNDRIDGAVGWPLPSVEARLVDPDTHETISDNQEDKSGEIQLRGPTIFRGYWQNPEATAKEFTTDGWFKTGDMAVRKTHSNTGTGSSGSWAQGPAYHILGRQSADIIKTGGEKVSALEIERQLLSLDAVAECAVVGLDSETWGQKVAAIVVLSDAGKTAGKEGKEWGAMDMRRALKSRLVAYKIPQDLKVVEQIPRNAMGKVNKKKLVAKVFGGSEEVRRRSVEVKREREEEKRKGGS